MIQLRSSLKFGWRDTSFRHPLCSTRRCVETWEMSSASNRRRKLLITTYQEVNDQIWSNTCCDDENERIGGNTDLPEQHFSSIIKKKSLISNHAAHTVASIRSKSVSVLVHSSGETSKVSMNRAKVIVWSLKKA